MRARPEYVAAARQVLVEAGLTGVGETAERIGLALELYYLRGYEAAVIQERKNAEARVSSAREDDGPDPSESDNLKAVVDALERLVMAATRTDGDTTITAAAKRYVSSLSSDDCVAIGRYFGKVISR